MLWVGYSVAMLAQNEHIVLMITKKKVTWPLDIRSRTRPQNSKSRRSEGGTISYQINVGSRDRAIATSVTENLQIPNFIAFGPLD